MDGGRDILVLMYFDSHAHLTCDALSDQVAHLLDRAKAAKVTDILNICTDQDSLEKGVEWGENVKGLYNAGATTPHDVEKMGQLDFLKFEKAARGGKLVAIGETGLDYHYEHSPKKLQQLFLRRYFKLATSCALPVVIHCRDAFRDLFAIADEEYREGAAVLHCFTGTLEEAEEVIKRGWFLSFSGIVTFKKSESLREVVRNVPLKNLLIETDAPYLAPQSRRGKQNEPSFLVETAEQIAKVKGVSLEEIATATRRNAFEIFKIAESAPF